MDVSVVDVCYKHTIKVTFCSFYAHAFSYSCEWSWKTKQRETKLLTCVSIGKKNKTKESLPWSLCQSHQPQKFNALSPWTRLSLLSFFWKLSLAALKNSFSRTSFEQKKSLLFCALF